MSEDDKRDRKFQYTLTKAQVDFEFWVALAIGLLAVTYGLLSFYKDNFLGTVLTNVLILIAAAFIIRTYQIKEQRFKDIKKEYIDS
jgi:hypothetical protein